MNMTIKLEPGDLVILQNTDNYKVNPAFDGNLFKIKTINNDIVELHYVDGDVLMSDISPIPINGVDDVNIYYNPIVAASIVMPGDPIPVRRTNYSYYMEAFKNSTFQNKTFYDMIQEQNLSYVHEIQQFLRKRFRTDDLKINYWHKI